jgi:hypothetical protein
MNASIRIRTDDFLITTDDGKALFLADGLRGALLTLTKPLATSESFVVEGRRKDILLLSDFCHSISRSRGWWNDPITGATLLGVRNFGEMLALIHSEISETFEAAASAPIDELDEKTGYPHVAVELSDILIRLFDLIAAERIDVRLHIQPSQSLAEWLKEDFTLDNFCVAMHADVTAMLEAHRKGKRDEIGRGAVLLIDHVFEAAAFCKLDLAPAFLAKCRYNLDRPDHSMEARCAAGGKAY